MKKVVIWIALSLWSVMTVFAGETAYLFSYFINDSKDGLHLAYSYDGLNWLPLHGGRSYLTPAVGKDKLMRDPSICQSPDGTFHMVWTSSWTDRIIGYASSRDLVHWSEQQAIPVMMHEPDAHNCWAPELFYDEPSQTYYIFWATTIPGRHKEVATSESEKGLNHRIYYVTTKDFRTFSKTKMFFNPDFSVIDAAIVKDPKREDLIMVVKNENSNPPEKNLRVTRTKKIEKGFPTKVSAPITGKYWAEGPAPLFVGDTLYVYFDKYRDHRYGAVRSLDYGETWEDVSDQVFFPRGIRHGTAFAVDVSIVESLIADRNYNLLIYSKQMDIAEYELGNFINNRVHSLKNFATDKRIKLEIKTEFNYASVWFDQSKISPIIDKFIKNAIEHSKPEDKRIIFSISSNSEHWELKTFDANKGKLLTCYRRQKYHLIKPKHKSEFKYAFAKSVLCKKLMKLCDGNILINHSTHTVSLRFPTTNSERKVSGYNIIHSAKKSEERKTDTSLGKIAHKKSSIKPTVVLADSNEEFKSYLEECLSKDFDVKSFGNGSEALECIKEKYPDLVICDLMLHGMYGYELSSRLKTSGETSVIPIILYGSRIDIGQRNKRESSLADIFLYVPFHIEDLKIEMNVLIKNNRSLRRSFLQTVFGKQFLEKEEEKDGIRPSCSMCAYPRRSDFSGVTFS